MFETTASAASVVATPSIHRTQLKSVLERLNGRFVGVDFVKTDGSARRLNGRLGVRVHAKGGVNRTVADSRPYITVFDVKANGYRTVNLSTVSRLRCDRQEFAIE